MHKFLYIICMNSIPKDLKINISFLPCNYMNHLNEMFEHYDFKQIRKGIISYVYLQFY